jgi:phosphohistidine swiveling domain-containing protein
LAVRKFAEAKSRITKLEEAAILSAKRRKALARVFEARTAQYQVATSIAATERTKYVEACRIFEACAHVFQERTHVTWTLEMVAACLTQELVDFFDKGIVPDAIQVGERLSQPWVYYREQAGAHLLGGEEMVKEVQGLIAAGFQQRQSIKGRTAFPGKVTGRVCLVRGKADLPRVQLGDVLVAKTTMPDYTPAMKLAAAFVTEEGGITSHAAIISREWKKPCVVGTGNCTKLLQDGDVVEVDAEQGIVRKI